MFETTPHMCILLFPYKTQPQVFTVEMHHQRVDFANPGDNVGLNIKGLDKNNMPRSGDALFAPTL